MIDDREPEKGTTIDYTKLRKFDIKDPGPELGPCSQCQGARFVMDDQNRCVPCPECLAKAKAGYAQFRAADLPRRTPTIAHDPPTHEDDEPEPERRP